MRGLGPQFTRVRINGMEALTTTGGTDSSGGANRGRGFDFNVFASELFNSITVRKTASADVEEGSLGATVDLHTARPFDYDGFTLVGALKGAYNDLAGEVDPRATLPDQQHLRRRQVRRAVLGGLHRAQLRSRKASSTVRWDTGSSVGGFNAASTPTGVTLAQANAPPRSIRASRATAGSTHEQERLGITGSLQWRSTTPT